MQRAVLDECLLYWEGEPLGYSEPEAWENGVEAMRALGYITSELDPSSLYTNEMLP